MAGGDPERYAVLLLALTVMAGVLYLITGASRLGFIANFLSQPILTGYLNGIALLIIAGQLPKLLGYPAGEGEFLDKILEFCERVDQSHWPTAALDIGLLIFLVIMMRFMSRLPSGWPTLALPSIGQGVFKEIFADAAGILQVSFTSGALTAKSFARRNGYEVDANHELIGFGASNLSSGLAQGFPVTGADSRTAVNNAIGGMTQLAGIVADGTMLVILLFLTSPLTYVPNTALAAVILVSAIGLFDLAELRTLYRMSYREFLMSVCTTLGVLVLGVLPGVLLVVALSLLWLLSVASRPDDAVLGKVKGLKGFYNVADYPEATTIPGLLLYRFESNLVFYNADYFETRIHEVISAQKAPVEWVVIDASPVNVVDVSALNQLDELHSELADEGIQVYYARIKRNLERFFNPKYAKGSRKLSKKYRFQTLNPAIRAYLKYQKAKGADAPDPDTIDPDNAVLVLAGSDLSHTAGSANK